VQGNSGKMRKKQGTCMSIDAAVPADRNVSNKEAEKILKYEDIIRKIQRMWNVKAKVIPVIVGRLEPFQNHWSTTGNSRATGTISKSLRQYLSNILGKYEIKELQKTAILCTTHCCGKCWCKGTEQIALAK
jgi:hypothetical protein